jgi:hypothetical protein
VVADALSRKETVKPLSVRSMRIDVRVDLMDQFKQAQASAMEKENVENEEMMTTVCQLLK